MIAPSAGSGSLIRPRPRRELDPARQRTLEIAAACLLALVLGWAVASLGAKIAVGLMFVPLAAAVLLARPFLLFCVSMVVGIVFPFTENAGFAQAGWFRVAAAGALATIAVVLLRTRLRPRPNVVDLAVGGFLALTVGSWLTYHHSGSLADTVNPILPFAFYFAARLVRREALWTVLWVIAGAGAIGGLSVLYEFLVTKAPLFIPPNLYLWNASSLTVYRPGGVFESPPAAAAIMSMATLCTIPLIERYRGRARLAAVAIAAIGIVSCFVTYTRAGIIGLGLGLVLFGLLGGSRVATPRRTAVTALVVVVAGAALFVPVIKHTRWYTAGIARQGNFSARVSYWTLAKPLITDSPGDFVLGRGPNSLPNGQKVATGRIGLGLAGAPVLTQIGPHSQYVRILLEQGALGLALIVLWMVGAPLRAIWFMRRAGPTVRPIIAALVAATASFAIVSAVDDSMRHQPTLTMAALVTGLLVAAVRPREQDEAPAEARS